MAITLWIILGIVALLVLFTVLIYNSLVRLKNKIENSWAQIDVQLKRRSNLIPNLVETVKGYAKHERNLLKDITKARAGLLKARTVEAKAKASNQITEALKTLFAVSENYPKLRANENFMNLQQQLKDTEDKIAYTRQHYNDMVMLFNTKIEVFPNNIFANILHFTKRPLFEVAEAERKNVKVKF